MCEYEGGERLAGEGLKAVTDPGPGLVGKYKGCVYYTLYRN